MSNVNDHKVAPEYIFTKCNASPLNRVDMLLEETFLVILLEVLSYFLLFFLTEVQLESSYPQKTGFLNSNNKIAWKRWKMSVFLRMVFIKQSA